MKFKNHILYITLFFVISGCSSIQQKKVSVVTDPEEKKIINTIKSKPNNYLAIGSAGDFYRQRYTTNNGISDAYKAINYYQKFIKLQPSRPEGEIVIYDLYYKLHARRQEENFARLSKQFESIQEAIRVKINPPELAEIYRLVLSPTENLTKERLKSLALEGIKKSPKAPSSYTLLANFYFDKEKYTPAIALLKQGLKHQPESAQLLAYLGEAYSSKAYSNDCAFSDRKSWENAVNYYLQAKKIEPKNNKIQTELAFSYLALNKRRLGLNEAKNAYKENPTISTLKDLSQAYIINGKHEKGDELLNNTTQFKGKVSSINSAQLSLRSGYWKKSLDYFKKYPFDHTEKNSLYIFIQASIASDLNNSNWRPKGNMELSPQNSWQKALLSFWKKEISNEELLTFANDVCKKIEANTYIGYRYFKNNQKEKAKFHLSQAIKQNIPLFIEDGLATSLLHQLNNEYK